MAITLQQLAKTQSQWRQEMMRVEFLRRIKAGLTREEMAAMLVRLDTASKVVEFLNGEEV
jgi:hypothetical protein